MSRVDQSLYRCCAIQPVAMNTTHIPPYDEWVSLLTENRERVRALHRTLGESTVHAVRREVVEAARSYTKRLGDVALRAGISLSFPDGIFNSEVQSIVMAGHQPVIYHPGLLEKVIRLQSISREVGATAINVTIDTDEGDGGRIIWPLLKDADVVIKQGSLAEGSSLYCEQRIVSDRTVSNVFADVCRDLEASNASEALERVVRVSKLYQALSGESIAIAHAIVRMSESGAGYLEVPLSEVVRLPTVRRVLQGMLDDAPHFVSVYNATLEAYRQEHKIKNRANPFPNMAVESDSVEVPLWEIRGGSRKGVRIPAAGHPCNIDDRLVAPRGSLVTLLLRGLCSDLFIHGLGGGKYDQFVDAFSEAYWGAPLPAFVVASSTRYLFPEQVAHYVHAREVKSTYKEMVSHTSTFIGRGLFSEEEEVDLSSLDARRQSLLEELRRASSTEERSLVAHAVNEVNRSIKTRIDHSSMKQVLVDGAIDDARLGRWACREYPFFFFPSVKCQSR